MTLPSSKSRTVSDGQRSVTPLIVQTELEQSNNTVTRPKLRVEPESPTCEDPEECMHAFEPIHSNIASVHYDLVEKTQVTSLKTLLKSMIMLKYKREDRCHRYPSLTYEELLEYGETQLRTLVEEAVAFCNDATRSGPLIEKFDEMGRNESVTLSNNSLASGLNSILLDFRERDIGELKRCSDGDLTLYNAGSNMVIDSELLAQVSDNKSKRRPALYESRYEDLLRLTPKVQCTSFEELAGVMATDQPRWSRASRNLESAETTEWSDIVSCIEVEKVQGNGAWHESLRRKWEQHQYAARAFFEDDNVQNLSVGSGVLPFVSEHPISGNNGSTAQRGIKRGRDDENEAGDVSHKKSKATGSAQEHVETSLLGSIHPGRLPTEIQCAFFGLELLRSRWGRTHSVVMLFSDDQFSVRWYDSQGCIRTEAVSLSGEELPLVVATIVLFQRFKTAMRGRAGIDLKATIDGKEVPFDIPQSTRARWALGGRRSVVGVPVPAGTADGKQRSKRGVKGASSTLPEDCPVDLGQYHFKWSWREETRDSEADIVKTARRRSEQYLKEHSTDVTDHLPQIMHDEDFPSLSTGLIRQFAELTSTEVQPRIPSLILSKRLSPLKGLDGYTIIGCIWDILRCIFLLWRLGVAHGDVSLGNIMVSHVLGQPIVLVLNDFDLAALMTPREKSPKKRGFDRAGTKPFMALDLLQSESGSVARLCRHDLESVVWVFPWYCASEYLAIWNDPSPKRVFYAKTAWLLCPEVVPGIPPDYNMLLATSHQILREWLPGRKGSDVFKHQPTQHIPDTLGAERTTTVAGRSDKDYLVIIAEHWPPKSQHITWEWIDWEVIKSDVLPEDVVAGDVED